MNIPDFEPMVILDGRTFRTLNSFEDVQAFLQPVDGATPVQGIARIVGNAQTASEREFAMRSFRKWARMTGIFQHVAA